MDDSGIPIDDQTLKALIAKTRKDILKSLSERRMTQAELAAKLGISETSVSRHLVHLEGADLVQREDSERKWKYIELTPKGNALVNGDASRGLFFRLFPILVALALVILALLALSSIHPNVVQQLTENFRILDKVTIPSPVVPLVNGSTTSSTVSTTSTTSWNSTTTTLAESTSTSASTTSSTLSASFDFQISLDASDASAAPGGAAQTVARVALVGGDAQEVSLSASGCPPSAQCTFSLLRGMPPFASQFFVNTSVQTPQGNYTVVVTALSANMTRSASFVVSVSSQGNGSNESSFNFAISSLPSSASVATGQAASFAVSVSRVGNSSGTVSLSHAGCPQSAVCSFTSAMGTLDFSTNFSVSTTPETPEGTHLIRIIGDGQGAQRETNVSVTVTQGVFDYGVSVFPSGSSVAAGQVAYANVSVPLFSGAASSVSLAVVNCPSTMLCSFAPSSGVPSFVSQLAISTSSNTTKKSYALTVRALGGNSTRYAQYNLTVT